MDQNQRPVFFEGQYLGAEDLEAIVAYERAQLARHELGAHLWGIGIGLDLRERTLPAGDVEVTVLPGVAWDGYGRTLLVAAPTKIPISRFANFQADTPAEGLLIKVWIRFEEGAARGPAPYFEACSTGSQFARAIENFAIEVGEPPTGPHGPVSVAGFSIDPTTARSRFLPTAKPLYDESVPYQEFPVSGSRPQWWIPLGYVRWLKQPGQAGILIARDNSNTGGRTPDADLTRALRKYIGVVAESVVAADGALRLVHREADPSLSHFKPPQITADPAKPPERDLVWAEGSVRIFGDTRIAGGLLEMRNNDGVRDEVPQALRRTRNAEGGFDLQVLFANKKSPAGANAFAVGTVEVDATSGELKALNKQFVVRDTGNVGIGAGFPTQLLTLTGDGNTRFEIGRVSATFPWSTNTPANVGGFAINMQSAGSSNPGADMALKRDGKLRVMLGNVDTFLSGQSGGVAMLVNHGEPGEQEVMRVAVTGNVGIGTTAPAAKLQLNGDLAMEKIATAAARALPPGGTLTWNDGTWLRLNQNLDHSKPIFGVHTPGVLAPGSLNVGGVASWGDPGFGNVWIAADTLINGKLTVNNGSTLNGVFHVNGASSINGATTINGATSVNGATTISGFCTLNGSASVVNNLTVGGNFHVLGFKGFVTPHPLANDQMLTHVCVEGPEAAVFYRGKGQLKRGTATVRLPAYFQPLTREGSATVQVTPVFDGDEAVVALAATEVVKGRFTVKAIGKENPSQHFHWEVKAVRADVPELVVEQEASEELKPMLEARRKART